MSDENCVSFLDPLIESWDIDFATFGIKITLNRRLGPEQPKRFEFVEQNSETYDTEPGLEEFLDDSSLSGDASERGNRVFEDAQVRRAQAYSPILLPRGAESQRPSPFPQQASQTAERLPTGPPGQARAQEDDGIEDGNGIRTTQAVERAVVAP